MTKFTLEQHRLWDCRIAQLENAVRILADKLLVSPVGYMSIQEYNELVKMVKKVLRSNDFVGAYGAYCKLLQTYCEACGGDGTVLLTDGYKGQVIATAKCIYCNGTGRVNKEREE